jgi:ribosomal protein S18 acetylase RimI-like enzyme
MDDVSLLLTDDPHEVDRLASAWLTAHAVDANVTATILAGEVSGRRHYDDQSWVVARDGAGEVVGVLVQTAPHPARIPTVAPAVAEAAARAWHAHGRRLPGAAGPVEAGEAFVRCWQQLTGVRVDVLVREGLHVLDRLEPPQGVTGTVRRAGPADSDLVLRWLHDFRAEALPDHPMVTAEVVAGNIQDGVYLIWEDAGQPVSLAGWRTAMGVGRVGPVYTPPEHRRRGYAAAVTAAATELVLDAGAKATLYTDLANPTSNGVYRRLGYRLVDELTDWRFTDA